MKNLSPRERLVLLGGGVVVALLVLVFGLVVPLSDALTGMDQKLVAEQERLDEAVELQSRIARVKSELAQLERKVDRRQATSLFSLIEKNSNQLGVGENLVSMRLQDATVREGFRVEAVDLRLEKIRFAQLVSLLKAFDSSPALLNVRQLKIKKRFDDSTLVDVNLQVESLTRGV